MPAHDSRDGLRLPCSTVEALQLRVDVSLRDRPTYERLPGVEHQADAPGRQYPRWPEVAGARDRPDPDQERVDDAERNDMCAKVLSIL